LTCCEFHVSCRTKTSRLPCLAKSQPEINFTTIQFPSDKLSIKLLRRVRPDQDASGSPDLFGWEGEALDTMMYLERAFATLGFRSALGDAKAAEEELAAELEADGVAEVAKELADCYVRFGLATGPAAASEFVRQVQAAGAAQVGRKRGRR
jgi:hypothetical protein